MACKLCPCKAARLGGYGLRNVYKSNVFGSAAARTEKSVDKARGETREQTFPEGDVFLFHKKYLRSPVWATEAVFMRVLIICG